ncbi:hypothetical protein [Modestobacter italicus]|uniref:hypothetical protein n=1 Tax=Modestobacter italicus (strain DSM 44449 / CECT 9708 / BC 501) TaxID=2732864 RepID=UPI0002D8AB86|nr:hypothetical protein [Modestobacter marinus]
MQRTLPPGLPARSAVLPVAACRDPGGSASPGADALVPDLEGLTDDLGPAC